MRNQKCTLRVSNWENSHSMKASLSILKLMYKKKSVDFEASGLFWCGWCFLWNDPNVSICCLIWTAVESTVTVSYSTEKVHMVCCRVACTKWVHSLISCHVKHWLSSVLLPPVPLIGLGSLWSVLVLFNANEKRHKLKTNLDSDDFKK